MSDLAHVTTDSFEQDVVQSSQPVVLDFWGPKCIPCIQIEPFVEGLSAEFAGKVRIAKVIAPENRKLCINLRVSGLPTFLAFRNGVEAQRLVGDNVTRDAVRQMVESLSGSEASATVN